MNSSTSSSTPPANPLAPGTVIPIVAAIGVFGTLYGAAAQPIFGSWLTMFSSIVIFSGTVQFSMVGLLAVGAGPLAVIWAIFVVNVRNFALGGALRPHLTGTRWQRMAVSWFLIDETVGLALAAPSMADRVLIRAGAGAYFAWVIGTAIGVAGGAALGLAGMASAIFPVLFIGLAALMVRSRGALVRAGLGVVITVGLLLIWPVLGGLAPVIGGIVAAIPGARGE
jgi:predicted branched-subunit amino acid permease